jgi:hypothetical protein
MIDVGFAPKADIARHLSNVRFVLKAEVKSADRVA